jgi:outer membrane protein
MSAWLASPVSAAQAYYGVLDAKAAVAAATDIEEAAKESLDDANALYQSGAGDLSDQLQNCSMLNLP